MKLSYQLSLLAFGAFGLLAISCASTTAPTAANPFGVRITHTNDVLRVELNGRLFTEYYYTNVPRPFCYPLIGPGGAAMTRNACGSRRRRARSVGSAARSSGDARCADARANTGSSSIGARR